MCVCVCSTFITAKWNRAVSWDGRRPQSQARSPRLLVSGETTFLTELLLSSPTPGKESLTPRTLGMWLKTPLAVSSPSVFLTLKTGGDIQLRKIPGDLSWLILWKMSRAARWLFQGSFSAGWVSESKVPIKSPSQFPWNCVCDRVIFRVRRPGPGPELDPGNGCCF